MMSERGRSPRIFMAAGEVSGDRQAGYLASAMLRQNPGMLLFGSGGESMRAAGVDVRVQTSHYGSVGIEESMRFIRPLHGVMSRLRSLMSVEPPDLAILVDNEGFNGLLAKFLHARGIPFVYFFPPQAWLWGEWRARPIARKATAIVAAFAQEAELYRREGGRVRWFGHPLLDIVRPEEDHIPAFRRCGLDPSARTIALMPGSRLQELEQLTGSMLGAAKVIRSVHPSIQVILPVAAPHLRPLLERELARTGMLDSVSIITTDIYTCLRRCDLIILSSGTATLEGALLGIPMVVAYRVSPVTYLLGRMLVKGGHIAMPNILLDERVIPELIQDEVTPERLAHEALLILGEKARSEQITKRLAQIRPMLGTGGVLDRVARFMLECAWAAIDVRAREERAA